MLTKKSIIPLLLIIIVQNAFAGNFIFKPASLNSQISNHAILSMYQDQYGFMWFGTYDGLNFYDGKDVTTFRFEFGNPHSLSGNMIHNIMSADKEHLWVATHVALDKFSIKQGKVVESYPNYNYKQVVTMAVNSKNETWVINKDNFLSYYDAHLKTFHDIPFEGLLLQDIRSMFIDENDLLYVVMKDGTLQRVMQSVSKDKYSLNIEKEVLHNHTLNNVFYEDRLIYFIDSEQNLYTYDKSRHQKIHLCSVRSLIKQYGEISSLCFFENHVYIGFFFGGLFKIDIGGDKQATPIEATVGVFSLRKDRSQSLIWVGTDGRGVNQYYEEEDVFGNILLKNLPLTFNRPVRCIYTDVSNSLWIGTKGDGIVRIKDYAKFSNKSVPRSCIQLFSVNKNELENTVYCFEESLSKKDLWIGGGKLSYYSYARNEVYDVTPSDSNNLLNTFALCEINDSTLFVSSEGLWKVTINKQVHPYQIKRKEQQIFIRDGKDTKDLFFSVVFDGDSILTLGSRKGYGAIRYNINSRAYKYISIVDSKSRGVGDVLCVNVDQDSSLYIGSTSGLTKISLSEGEERGIKQFGRKDGLINDMIHGILKDNTGIIWLSTSKGLVKYNPLNDAFLNIMSGSLQVAEFSDGAYWSCPYTQRLFFGGVNGLVWINPKEESHKTEYIPNFLFCRLYLDGEERTLYEYNTEGALPLCFSAKENTFQISFAVLDYINVDNYDFYYMLDGYDSDWISLQKSNKISFKKLPSGEYVLKVKYRNGVVNSREKIYSLSIIVYPPWYLSHWAYFIYVLTAIIVLFLIYIYIKRKYRQKQEELSNKIKREQLEKLYESKMNFFTNISHELCTPLTLINGAVDQIINSEKQDVLTRNKNVLHNNVNSLNELIEEILDYRQIEEGYSSINRLESVSVSDLLENILNSYMGGIAQNGISLQTSIQNDLVWVTDKRKLTKIVSNLLSNALKYTNKNGLMRVNASEEKGNLRIAVYNTGKGIAEEKIKSIFNRYQVLEDTNVNADNQLTSRHGLGLSISDSLTKQLNGKLELYSEENKSAEFVVILPTLEPLEKNDMGRDEKITVDAQINTISKKDTISSKASAPQISNSSYKDDSLPTILAVDDNAEVVDLISDILSHKYNVLKAYNVRDAYKILEIEKPAIIITDVMMPVTDGLAFAQALKNDKYYKHLPIIALSAKNTDKDVVKGYEAGVDVYVKKPFSPDVLLSVLKNQLENREKIEDYYETAESVFEYYAGKLTHKKDRDFIEELSAIIKDNISDENLNPDFLAEKSNMTSRGLYRQLKKVLGISTRDFIKDVRLSYAARLLVTTDMSIKEIMHKVGLSHRSYFYNEFFKKYNLTPREYRDGNEGFKIG